MCLIRSLIIDTVLRVGAVDEARHHIARTFAGLIVGAEAALLDDLIEQSKLRGLGERLRLARGLSLRHRYLLPARAQTSAVTSCRRP